MVTIVAQPHQIFYIIMFSISIEMMYSKHSLILATTQFTNRLNPIFNQETFMVYTLSAFPIMVSRTNEYAISPKSLVRFTAEKFSTFLIFYFSRRSPYFFATNFTLNKSSF